MGVVEVGTATPAFRPRWWSGLVPEDGTCSFTPPRTFSGYEVATPGDARDGALSDPQKIIMKLRANWGRASARQIIRAMVNPGGDNLRLLQHVNEVSEHCEVCRSLDCAPHVTIAGTPSVSTCYDKLQADLPRRMTSLRRTLCILHRNVRHFIPRNVLR